MLTPIYSAWLSNTNYVGTTLFCYLWLSSCLQLGSLTTMFTNLSQMYNYTKQSDKQSSCWLDTNTSSTKQLQIQITCMLSALCIVILSSMLHIQCLIQTGWWERINSTNCGCILHLCAIVRFTKQILTHIYTWTNPRHKMLIGMSLKKLHTS